MSSSTSGSTTAPIRQVCESCDKKYALSPPDAAPVMLQCLHRFCSGCVATFEKEAKEKGNQFACIDPDCDTEIPGLLLGLPIDTASLRQTPGSLSTPLCGSCEEDVATTWCKDCGKFFCDDCHSKKGKMKMHTLVPAAEHLASGGASAAVPPTKCWQHPDQSIKVYCADCGVAACLECGLTQHNGHTILKLEDAKAEQVPLMASLVTTVQEGIPKVNAAVEAQEGAVKELRANKEAADAAVEASFLKKAQVLLARKKSILKEIATIEAEKKQVLDARVAKNETTNQASENAAALVACILEHGSAAEILIAKPSVTSALGKLIKEQEILLAPKHNDTKLEFVDNMPELEAQLGQFGHVSAAKVDVSKCAVTGAGAGVDGIIKAGAEVAFNVNVVDDEGNSMDNAALLVAATLLPHSEDGNEAVSATTVKLSQGVKGVCIGTYTAPETAAKYVLSIELDGQLVQGSPFAITVATLLEFSGIKIESDQLSAADLVKSGWKLAYQKLYNHTTTVAELDALKGKRLLVAARKKGSDILTVAAMGDKDSILKRTTESDEAHEHNGAYWYCFEGNGFGFAPNGTVTVSNADSHDGKSPQRLSWHMRSGGWRAGSNTGLNDSDVWEKLVFTRD